MKLILNWDQQRFAMASEIKKRYVVVNSDLRSTKIWDDLWVKKKLDDS